jgi:GGDEF domain-containing protein
MADPTQFSASQAGPAGGAAALPATWVTDSVRRFEPVLLAGLAGAMAGTAAMAGEGLAGLCAVATVPMAAAAWSRACPARRQVEVVARGALVASAALLAGLSTGAGDGALLPAWLGLVALVYAFLLHWLRHRDARREAGRFDPVTGLFTLQGLCASLDLLGRGGRPAAVAVFDCGDLLEIREIYGARIGREMVRRVVRAMEATAGEKGYVARTGPAEFTVVLPGAGRRKVLAAVQQVFGTPSRVEYEAGDEEIMVVPDVLIGIAHEGEDVASLQSALSRKLQWNRAYEERRRDWLRRERERHSRPHELESPRRGCPEDLHSLPVLTAAV